MRFIVLVLLTILTSVTLPGCRYPNSAGQDSTLQSIEFPPEEGTFDFTKCECSDMACWNKETASKTAEQLRCAKDALSAAFPVVGTIADLGIAAASLGELKADLEGLESALRGGSKTLETIKEYAPGCLKNGAEVSESLVTLMANSTKIASDINELFKADSAGVDLKTAAGYAKNVADVAKSFVSIVKALTETSECLDKYFNAAKAPADAAASVKTFKDRLGSLASKTTKLSKSWDQMKTGDRIKIATTIATCGVRIIKGIDTLVKNTQCLANDFKELAEGRKAIINQTAEFASNPSGAGNPNDAAVKADPNLCLGQPQGNSVTLMGKLGAYYSTIALGEGLRESDSLYADRCAEVCGDGGNGPICGNFLATQDFGVGCGGFCATRQASSAITTCVSFCCLNSNDCRDRALKKAGYATKELEETKARFSANAQGMGEHCGQGDGRNDLVRDLDSSYWSKPAYETCSDCCANRAFSDGSTLAEGDRPGCQAVCVNKGKELGKRLRE